MKVRLALPAPKPEYVPAASACQMSTALDRPAGRGVDDGELEEQ
jgi:hypothetical protein